MGMKEWQENNDKEIERENRKNNTDLLIGISLILIFAFGFVGCTIQIVPAG